MPVVAELVFCLTSLFRLEAGCDLICLNNVSLVHFQRLTAIHAYIELTVSQNACHIRSTEKASLWCATANAVPDARVWRRHSDRRGIDDPS
jgi:hypothetical protein